MQLNAVLFDLDGTLVDTAPDLAYALNTLLVENNISKKPYVKIRPLVSYGAKALIKFGFDMDESHPDFSSYQQKLIKIYLDNIDQYSQLFQSMGHVLEQLRFNKIFWGVVTNKSEHLTHVLLKKLNLTPDVVVCGDTLEHNKPHPAQLEYACAKLALKPEHCLFVGDDKNDLLAGNCASIKTVFADYGYGKSEPDWQYDYLIKKPLDLLEVIDAIV